MEPVFADPASVLPWLVVHGEHVWRLSLLALLLLGTALGAMTPALAARWRARRIRRLLGAPWDVDDESAQLGARGRDAPAVLSGRLVAPGEDRPVGLEVGDAFVDLRGELRVLVGSHEELMDPSWARPPSGARTRIARALETGLASFSVRPPMLRTVAPGDRVRIVGRLAEEPGPKSLPYRSARGRWVLSALAHEPANRPRGEVDSPDGGNVETALRRLTVAFEGAPRVRGGRARAALGGAVGGAAVFGVVFVGVGELAAGVSSSEVSALWRSDASPMTALAAATPLRRAQTLARIQHALETGRSFVAYDGRLPERLFAVRRLRGDCGGAAQVLIEHGQLERAATVAEGCGAHDVAARAAYLAGDFARASAAFELGIDGRNTDSGVRWTCAGRWPLDAWPRGRAAVRAHLLAADWAAAATAARRLGVEHSVEEQDVEVPPDERSSVVACLADALAARAGEAAAYGDLARRARERGGLCRVLHVDLLSAADRLREISRPAPPTAPSGSGALWLELLRIEALAETRDADESPLRPETIPLAPATYAVVLPGRALAGAAVGLERAAAKAAAALPGRRAREAEARLAARMATFESIAGHPDDARAWYATADAAVQGLDSEAITEAVLLPIADGASLPDHGLEGRLLALHVVLEIQAGDFAAAHAAMAAVPNAIAEVDEVRSLLRFVVERDLAGAIRDAAVPDQRGFRLIELGDGAALAERLRRPNDLPAGAFLRAGAPMLWAGQHELAEWVRWGFREPAWRRACTDALVDAANLEATARIVRADDMAAPLAAITERFRSALLRRDIALPLAVLDSL